MTTYKENITDSLSAQAKTDANQRSCGSSQMAVID